MTSVLVDTRADANIRLPRAPPIFGPNSTKSLSPTANHVARTNN